MSKSSNIYEDKLKKIIEGFWTIRYDQFSVQIHINNFSRILNQNELHALKTQIELSYKKDGFTKIKEILKNLESKDDLQQNIEIIKKEKSNYYLDDYKEDADITIQIEFLYHYYKMKKYKKIIQYFAQQGINKFSEILDKPFDFIEEKFNIFDEDIYLSKPQFTFSLRKMQSTIFRNIGNCIQRLDSTNVDEIFNIVLPYLNAISGQIMSASNFYQKVIDFLNNLKYDILFDPTKLGYSFCTHILIPSNIEFKTVTNQSEDLHLNNIIDTIPELKESIQNAFFTKNLLFFKVCRPAHCYHCIKSLSKLLTVNNRSCLIYFNEKSLIFCKNGGNFAEQIQDIPKSSVKDSENSSSSTVYFIIHPETLNDEDNSLLEEFISTRICYINDTDLPKVIIISTLDFERPFSFFSAEFREIKFNINDTNEIEALFNLSMDPEYVYSKSFYLFKSELSGAGKTYQILERMKQIQIEQDITDPPASIFIDANMKHLKDIDKKCNICHFDLSPELFDEKFEFFDDLWIFCNLNYHILPNGENIRTPNHILFEVPSLSKNQYPEGGCIRDFDFPIAISDVVEVKSSDIKIPLSDAVKNLCKIVFKPINGGIIKYTVDLLEISLKMFYPTLFDDTSKPCIDLRVINETNLFLNYFCKDLKLDNDEDLKLSKAIFLLLLRTNLHIWTMGNVFKDKTQPKSFIIMAHHSLFGQNTKEKWNLLCFVSKDEKDENKWETKYLLNEIRDQINNISDSTLLQNDFFNILEDNYKINIYTNFTDFQNDQIVFLNIISSFFLVGNDENSLYSNIIDSSIISMYYDLYENDNNVVEAIENTLLGADVSTTNYIENNPDGLQSLKVIINILKNRKNYSNTYSKMLALKMMKKKIEEENHKKYPIGSMILTVTLVKRFIIMILRIILNQPLILEGFTGVGKTAAVHLLKVLFDLVGNSLGWTIHQIDCHGDLLFDNIQEDVIQKNLENSIRIGCDKHIFFFDELNTSPGSCYVINYMNNYGMTQKLAQDSYKITFIAAINPYIEVDKTTRDLSRVGIKQIIPTKLCKLRLCKISPKDRSEFYETPDLNKLAYNVRELSESTKMIVLPSDPELFLLTENNDSENDQQYKFLPPDEKAVIKNMIIRYYNTLLQIIPQNDHYESIINEINKYREATVNIIYNLLCDSFLCIRELMTLRSILSYRDVKRFMMHFLNFCRKEIKHHFKESKNINNISEFIRSEAIPNSIVYSLVLSIVFRFSSSTKIEKAEKQTIKDRCKQIKFNLEMNEEGDFIIIDICSSLLERLMKIEWKEIEKPEINWIEKIIDDFSSKIFNKYAKDQSIFKVKSLVIHLFAITSCFSVSKHFPDEPIMPCLIIGMPGTSKTLAIQLFIKHKSTNDNFYSTTYLSTRASEADGLNAHYRDCAMFMIEREKDGNNPMAICVIDELGLANLNETRPLKLLHYYFDKGIAMKYKDDYELSDEEESKVFHVMSIAASNYALDFANMNRGILICTDLPSDDDISNSFSTNTKQVKKFLSELWKLTKDEKRPEMLALRPLYLLYNVLFFNKKKYFYDVCTYLTSVVSCHPSKSVEKANILIEKLGLKDQIIYSKTKKMNTTYIMSDVIKSFVISEYLSRALCIRTQNYDCLDFIENLISSICEENNLDANFHHIYPNDFKLPSHICANHALKKIFNLITDQNIEPNTKNFFLIIGNASFSDSLLDLLNVPSKDKGDFNIGNSSLISQNGFSIKLNSIPKSFKIIFILNDEDFEKKYTIDSFPLPLLDRFDQLYFDYNSQDKFDIIKKQREFRKDFSHYLIPDCEKIHNYFTHFIDKLSEVKRPDPDTKNPVIIIEETEDGELPRKFVENEDVSDLFNVHLYRYGENVKAKPESRIIGRFKIKENEEDVKIIEKTRGNIRKLKLQFENAYFANHSRNDFYELEENEKKRIIRKRLFKFNIESLNGSIVGLNEYFVDDNEEENKKENGFSAIVFTVSPMMEKLKGITKQNSIIIFDQYIQSAKSFEEKINNELTENTKYIIIQSNQFSGSNSKSKTKALSHDRHLRNLLNNENYEYINRVIIYHLKDSVLPEGINTSSTWPVFWLESVSDSPLDANDSNKITKCILFRSEYRNNYSELVKNMLEQLYLDLWTNFNLILPNSFNNNNKQQPIKKTKKGKKKNKKQNTKSDKSDKLNKQDYSDKLYPKLINEIRNEIFQEIITNESKIANEQENYDDLDDSTFRSIFDSLKQNDTYKKIDLKRLFYEQLKNYMPTYLSFFIKLLISNTLKINSDKNHLQFIKKLYKSGFIQANFKNYYANQFQPFQVDSKAPYFPELILEQVLILYDQKYTGSLCEIFEYINQYIDLQPSKENIVINYLNSYFIPFIEKTSHKNKDKEKIKTNQNDFYKAFEDLLLLRGGYSNESNHKSLHKHLQMIDQQIPEDFTYQNYLHFQFKNENCLIEKEEFRDLMKSSNNLIDLFFKYQLLTNVCDESNKLTSVNKDDINSSNSIELTQMIVLGRPFMNNDIPIIDFISKINKNESDKNAEDYIFNRPSFINMIYFEKLIDYLKGDRKTEFKINHDDTFFNYHYVFPENAFNIINVNIDNISETDLAIIGEHENTQFSPQLFTENEIFTKTYDLIKSIEFPIFTTTSKSYIKNPSEFLYPHEMIRKHILTQEDYQTDSFSEWLFDTDAPLFVRQLYSTFNSIKSQNENEIIRELTVFSLLLNPWSKDPSSLILFWNYVNENINNFIPKKEDEKDKYSRIEQNILKAFEQTKWNHQLQEGKVFYIYDHKCIKPQFIYEINYQLDHLIFTVAISNKSCSDFVKYSNMFKSLPYIHHIKEIPIILALSEFLQKKFVIELDILFVVLNTLNCKELTKIGDEMKGITLYNEIQKCIENNEGLLESNKIILKQNQIKDILLRINQIYPGKCAYEQINLFTHKIVNFYNNCFSGFYDTEKVKFNHIQLSSLFFNFDINKTFVISSFMITHENGNESNCIIDIKNFLQQAFSYKTKFLKNKIDMSKSVYPRNAKLISYSDDADFLGFKVGQFSNSIFANIDIKEVMFNMKYFIKVENNDDLYKEKCFAMAVKCRPYNDSNSGDAFDALAYLLVMLSRSKEKVNDNVNRFLFYDIANNNKSRINQVFENLRSLESNVDFQKSRVHIKGQSIIKEVMKRIIPKEILNTEILE